MPARAEAAVKPQLELREAAVKPAETALLFIDCQKYNCTREGKLYDGQKPEVSCTA